MGSLLGDPGIPGHGATPDFDEIFPEGGEVANFFDSLKSFGSVEKGIHS